MIAGLLATLLALGQPGFDDHEEHAHGEAPEAGQEAFEPETHLHPTGEQNHGTEWFFNQPWADSEGWGTIARDSAILFAAASCVFLVSGRKGRLR